MLGLMPDKLQTLGEVPMFRGLTPEILAEGEHYRPGSEAIQRGLRE